MRKLPRTLKAVGGVLMIGLLAWWLVSRGAQQRDIALAREMLRLAPLPADAADVHAASIHSWTWESAYVKFGASPATIEAFLAASPGLKRLQIETFTPRHMYLPYPSVSVMADPDSYAKNAYFHDDAQTYHLPWFDPTIKSLGRRYRIRGSDDTSGEVVVDDARHLVYIYADEG